MGEWARFDDYQWTRLTGSHQLNAYTDGTWSVLASHPGRPFGGWRVVASNWDVRPGQDIASAQAAADNVLAARLKGGE